MTQRIGRPPVNMAGKPAGKLTVEREDGKFPDGARAWMCRCECGNTHRVRGSHLKRALVTMCPACKARRCAEVNTTHGATVGRERTQEYRSWAWMRRRCRDTKTKCYRYYGGAGVKVCPRWDDDFAAFLADMGPAPGPGYTIDRYPDTLGNYEPDNCRWATMEEQANNRTNNRWLAWAGESHTLAQWEKITGIPQKTIGERIDAGWSTQEALTIPVILGSNQTLRN